MPELEDIELLSQYARDNFETAFAELVTRHVNMVYSTALRCTGNAHAAQEIAQAVFIILARKARSLSKQTILSGWLHQTARLTAANYLRTELRRQKREQEAFMQSTLNESELDVWTQIAPLLDDAISRLGQRDRDAIALRFFENKSAREIGEKLRVGESVAQKRVTRAVEKLRKFFTKRGVTLSAVAIAGAVSANSVQAAPLGLAKTISAVAIAKGATAGGSTLALVKGALKIMAWTKAKMAIVVGAGILLAAGTTTVTVEKIEHHKADDSWRTIRPFDGRVLERVSPQVEILPAKLPSGGGWDTDNNGKMMGTGVGVETIVQTAYGFQSNARTIFSTELPKDKYYDFIASLPNGNAEALQQEIKKQFGVVARRETIETNILLLTVNYSDASGLKPDHLDPYVGSSIRTGAGYYSFHNETLSDLAVNIEYHFQIPVIDQTGLTNRFDFDLRWNEPDWHHRNLDNLKQALIDQLGLELVPTNMPIEMLVVEKSN